VQSLTKIDYHEVR